MEYQKIKIFKQEDLYWPFHHNQLPYFTLKHVFNEYSFTIHVNPFPCSTIDTELMKKEVERVEAIFPIGTLLQWVILPYEVDGFTNAWASSTDIWKDDTEEEKEISNKHLLEGAIVISGKRTIVHPAMASYLAAHEYGHQVDYWITKKMKEEDKNLRGACFRKMYADMRGIECKEGYGGGRWKGNIGEIIADDFRIAVCKTDVDFYEHPVEHPAGNEKVIKFWRDMYKKYSFKNP